MVGRSRPVETSQLYGHSSDGGDSAVEYEPIHEPPLTHQDLLAWPSNAQFAVHGWSSIATRLQSCGYDCN